MKESTVDLFERLADEHWLFKGRREVFNTFTRAALEDQLDAVILDTGCCSGAMMKEMSRLGSVFGIDISEKALRACDARGLTDVCRANCLRMPFADGSLDLVTAFDVIEHIEDESSALSELRRITRTGGRVVLSVPAYQFMWNSDDDLGQHKRRYTRAGLRRKLLSAGFFVERISYFYTIIFPVNLMLTLTRKAFRIKKSSESVGLIELPQFQSTALLAA